MEEVIKDILTIKSAGEELGKLQKEVCPICGSEIYVIDGKSFFMCDCDKICPAEYSNV
jgi:NAD-dependent DNA ligase